MMSYETCSPWMNISDEKKFHHEILITPIFNICASLMHFYFYFCQNSSHQTNNCPYQSSSVLHAHIIFMDHRPYLVPILV
jgi:hypothetical protein